MLCPKKTVLLVALIAVFILIYVVKVDKHCPAHPFVVHEDSSSVQVGC